MRRPARLPFVLRWLWASPNTLLGAALGSLGLATGGGVQRRGGVIEFHGGLVDWMLRNIPPIEGGAAALTLGHVVLGRDRARLDATRAHEAVHVRQYETWGPFFIPLYLGLSAVLYLRGRDAYRENPFEREAYDQE
ncbi:MAG: hypothetical protein ACRC1K_08390 [Planctomycetia bacterium]